MKIPAIIITTLAVLLILSLLLSASIRLNKKQAFSRNYAAISLRKIHQLELPSAALSIVGISSERIFLAETSASSSIFSASLTNYAVDTIPIDTLATAQQLYVSGTQYLVRNPQHAMFSVGDLGSGKIISTHHLDYHFVDLVPLTNNTFIFSSAVSKPGSPNTSQALGIFNLLSNSSTLMEEWIRPSENYFITTGFLRHAGNGISIYTYSFRGKLLVIDGNARSIRQFNTADSLNQPPVNALNVGSDKIKLESVSRVNENAQVDNDHIYIHSTRMAANDTSDSFKSNATIDVYSITGQSYIGTFTIPNMNDSALINFKISDNIVVAHTGKYLTFYEIEFRRRGRSE